MLAAFLRNDNDPGLATKAVLIGGVFNVFGDYFCVFTLDWGLFGAGFATACGSVISLVVMLTHFFGKKNTLKLVWPKRFVTKIRKLVATGFSTFFIDVAMGILTILFNRQILKYLGTDALSVYGVIINISTFAQCCAYSIGQTAQPIISINFGAEKGERIRETLKYALGTVAFFALFWTVLSMAVPNLYTNIFMTPTEKILEIAPSIIRCYSISFILLPLNIFSTYYFQALMKPAASFVVSVGRGAVISGILIFLLPVVAGADAIWFAMPITELSEQYVQQIIEHHPLTSFPIHIGRSFHYPAINPVVQQQQKVHMEQSRLIRELAEQSDCVIVGRCADQILSELEPFRIFVYADMDSKIRRCMEKATEKEPLTERELKKHIMDIDRARAKYYSFYTNRKWGDKLNYDLFINTTGLVIREIVPVIAKMF